MIFRKKWTGADDAELIKAIAEKNEAAFRELLNRYQDKMLNYAYRFSGDINEAGDVAQETFLRIFRTAGSFNPGGSVKSLIYKITRNLCIDLERKKRPDLLAEPPEIVHEDTPLDALDRKEKIEALSKAVTELPEKQRTAILLRHTEGFSYAEISKIMELSVSAVESLLVRGRKNLRERLIEHENGY